MAASFRDIRDIRDICDIRDSTWKTSKTRFDFEMKEIPYRGSGPTEFLEIKHHFWYYMVPTCFKQLVMEASIGPEDQNRTVLECRPRPVATEVAMFYTQCNACDSQQKKKDGETCD